MKNFISNITNKISNYFKSANATCRLLEIDLSKQEVKFQIKMKLPILKCSIDQAINELNLIANLSSIEACYLGGHYGRIICSNSYTGNKIVSFSMKKSSSRCHILYEDRYGNIGYYDSKLQKEFIEAPFLIAANENLISLFNSSQACHIGILAGIKLAKNENLKNYHLANKDNKKTPHLRLV